MPPRPLLPAAAVGVTLVFWASAFVAIRHLGHDFSPGTLSLGRLVVGAACLGLVTAARPFVRPTRAEWGAVVGIGVLWYAVYNVALNAGERLVDAGTAAIVIQVSPVLIAVLAATFLGERFSLRLGAGLALAFTGVALIGLATSPQGVAGDPRGVLLCLVAAVAYSVSVVLQKPLMARLPAAQVTWLACTVGAVACLPFSGRLVGEVADAAPSSIAWVVYLGAFPTAVAFTTYAYALRHMSATGLGATTYLVPPVTIALGWILLGETPPAMAYVGGAVALVGVGVARRTPRRRVAAGAPGPP